MISEKLELRMKGWAIFLTEDTRSGNQREEFIHNAIQALAKDITARNLILDPAARIDEIALYYLGNLVFAKPISQTSNPSTAQVTFQALFSATDFSGNFDAARLTASGLGDFSVIDALVGSKTITETLLVTWNIQIN